MLLSAGILAGVAFAVPDGNWEPLTAQAAVLPSAAVPDGNWEPFAVPSSSAGAV